MKKGNERTGVERRVFSALNAKPPYLTKKGPVLYDRRTGQDRRQMANQDVVIEAAASIVE